MTHFLLNGWAFIWRHPCCTTIYFNVIHPPTHTLFLYSLLKFYNNFDCHLQQNNVQINKIDQNQRNPCQRPQEISTWLGANYLIVRRGGLCLFHWVNKLFWLNLPKKENFFFFLKLGKQSWVSFCYFCRLVR